VSGVPAPVSGVPAPVSGVPAPVSGVRSTVRGAVLGLRLAFAAAPLTTVSYVVTVLAGGLVTPLAAALVRDLMNVIVHGEGLGPATRLALRLAALGVVTGIMPSLQSYAQAQVARRTTRLTQDRLFGGVNRLRGLARLEQPTMLDRLRLAQQAATMAPSMTLSALSGLGQATISAAGLILVVGGSSPILATVVVLAALPVLAVQLHMTRLQADAAWRTAPVQRRQFFYQSLLSDLTTAKELRLFGLGGFFKERMLGQLAQVQDVERRLDRRSLWFQFPLSVLSAAVAAGCLLWSAAQAATGRLTVGDLSVLVVALPGVQAAVGALISGWTQLARATLLVEHYLALSTTEPDLPTATDPRPVLLRRGITFEGVWFRYGTDDRWVLRGLDLFLPQGCVVGIVGANGAGKSTLVKLLCRLYDPTRGRILWDGVDIREFDVDALRQRISTVFQDRAAFELPAAESIGIGALASIGDRERIVAAATLAGLHETLAGLPAGYDTMLSRIFFADSDRDHPQAGVELSGGQWQRVALARSLMRTDVDLMILDEPVAHLDPAAEYEVNQTLLAQRRGKTSVLVSHRLSSMRDADLVVVLAGGAVTELGSHENLVAAGGAYAALFARQAQGYTDVLARAR
jgi:ATP-binding cassette subfamily B protein